MPKHEEPHSLTVILTHDCNLNCIYCYEHSKSNQYINSDVAKNAITEFITRASSKRDVEIVLHGGEPFLAFNIVRELCEWMWSNTWPVKYQIFMTTNGTLVHGEIKRWLSKHSDKLVLGLSLDGNRKVHNLNRSNSYDMIDRKFFLAKWPNQSVKMTISPFSLKDLEKSIVALHKQGFKVNANLAYGLDWNKLEYVTEYRKQLRKLADFYLNNPQYPPSIAFATPITAIGEKESSNQKFCGVGTAMRAVDLDGRMYPCQMFMALMSGKELQHKDFDWTKKETITDPSCQECVIKEICPTCYGNNLINRGHPATRDKSLCRMIKVQIEACLYFEANKLARNKEKPKTAAEAAIILDKIRKIEFLRHKFG